MSASRAIVSTHLTNVHADGLAPTRVRRLVEAEWHSAHLFTFRSAADARNHRRPETELARRPGEMTHSGPYPPNKVRNGRTHL